MEPEGSLPYAQKLNSHCSILHSSPIYAHLSEAVSTFLGFPNKISYISSSAHAQYRATNLEARFGVIFFAPS
jgi:hypothetical protein